MPEFQQLRDELASLREAGEKARLDASRSAQQLLQLQQQRALLERQKGDNNSSYIRQRELLDRRIAAAKEDQAGKKEEHDRIKGQLKGIEIDFELFIDPRRELTAHFTNQVPFLLFPMRMETRFKTVGNKQQLWVRVYPDDCMVDSFEPLLSGKEVNNAARFWAEYYAAGKPADPLHPDAATLELQKAAWRILVSAHGDGRAAWITRQLKPDPATSVFPVRGPKTVILAIYTGLWDPAKAAAITGMFRKIWLADGNQQTINKVKNDFNGANPGLDADTVIRDFQPVNFNEKLPLGLTRPEADLQFAIVVFTDLDKKAGKEHGWSQATRVNIMPERLALLRYKGSKAMEPVFGNAIPYPLPTSPDPSSVAGDQFKENIEHDLEFAEPIKWVADFDRAVDWGMGFRVDLGPDDLDGFSRLLVLGVRLGSDEADGEKQLAELFDHHYYSKKGLSLVPQGTPTNNTGDADSGYTASDAADETFDLYFNQRPGYKPVNDSNAKADGQWLSEWLGLGYDFTTKLLHGNGADQADARNMNTALWPATLGYVMESLMQDGFSPAAIERTREFFRQFVSGRGPVPTIRIGNQPYGILPTTAFKRMVWPGHGDSFTNGMYQLLLKIDNYWNSRLTGTVAHVTQQSTEVYKTLLDTIALHPVSVEFHRRYMETLIEMSNTMSLKKSGFFEHSGVIDQTLDLLRKDLGYTTDILPQLAALLALPWQYPVPYLVDDQPLSESKGIRDYTADKKNYITVLIEEAKKSLDAIRTGELLAETPHTELYKLLKYALEQGYHSSGIGAAEEVNAFDPAAIAKLKTEQPFIQQSYQGAVTASRYALLYDTVPAISPNKSVAEFVRDSLISAVVPSFSKYLGAQIEALEQLQSASTARLERAFVEHIDCCSYRLDAWKTGLISRRLSDMRNNNGDILENERRTGLYIGAFGWLENVRPERNKVLQEVTLPEDVKQDFNPGNKKAFLTDPTNEGYIHAPSLNQAVTAAVLRNGYISHGKPESTNVLSVNLSSERIRLALSVIEGVQGGQSLAALLGYHFERELHDRNDLKAKSIDSYIYPIRKIFPLAADQLKETSVKAGNDPSVDPDTIPITAVEARNVVHGVNLCNYVIKQPDPSGKKYPFGLALPNTDPLIATAITEAVNHIIDIADALADLGMAESVHHIVMGNYDRAAGVLESYTKGNYPQEPDVIRTPRSGATLTHRIGIPMNFTVPVAGTGPRAEAEPSINQWLKQLLPALNKISCRVSWISRADGNAKEKEISMDQLGLEPIDLLYMNDLDDSLIGYIHRHFDPQLDANIRLRYTDDPSDPAAFSFFQVGALLKSLRKLVLESAPLTPGDISLPNETEKKDQPDPQLPVQRVVTLRDNLISYLTTARANPGGILFYLDNLLPVETATPADLNAMLLKADDSIEKFSLFLNGLLAFGIPQTGSRALYTERQQWFVALKNIMVEVRDRWQKKSDDYDALAADPTPSVEKLQAMERLISSAPTPAATISLAIVTTKKGTFNIAFKAIKDAIDNRQPGIVPLVQQIQALDIASFDVTEFDISKELGRIPAYIYDLQARAKTLTDDLELKKIPAINAILTELPTLKPANQSKQIQAAARIILGDSFTMVPNYFLPPAQAAELGNSWNATTNLLDYSINDQKRSRPTEDWLHGIARVNEKMKSLENCIMLREAFGLTEDDLTMHPVQLPFKSNKYHWLALPFPEADIDPEETNTLLYTAFTSAGAAAPASVCGLLATEWTELIPAKEETTGIAFHYDRPNSEAPQTLLLVAPASTNGNWQWNDLSDALIYALDAARSRGVEPTKIDETTFAALVPAVIGAESLYPYSIVLDNKAHLMTEEMIKNF